MRKSLIRWVLLAVIVLGIIIGGPIIINEFYRNNSGYMTIWGAADVLFGPGGDSHCGPEKISQM